MHGHRHARKGAPPTHLVRHGIGAPDDPIALCLYSDSTGYARYANNNSYAVQVEASEGTDKQKLHAYYRSGSLAVTLDGDNNGSVMDPRGKCVCLLTSQGGIAKILHPKTGAIMAQYTKPPDTRTRHGHGETPLTTAGRRSAEGGSESVLRASHSNISLLTDEGAAAAVGGAGGEGNEGIGDRCARWRRPLKAPAASTCGSLRGWSCTVPSTWELRVNVDNDKVSAEFSNLHEGRLVKAKGADKQLQLQLQLAW